MAPYPDLTNPTLFPTFEGLPFTNSPTTSSIYSHALLAQVKQNMTITKPTLIATDRSGADFAITFAASSVDLSAFKVGHTAVIFGAKRTVPEGESSAGRSRQGFVVVAENEEKGVKVLPAAMGRVIELASKAQGEEGKEQCSSCGKEEDKMRGCTGCGRVKYCGKECQTKSWTEGHKSSCKVLKAMNEVWGAPC